MRSGKGSWVRATSHADMTWMEGSNPGSAFTSTGVEGNHWHASSNALWSKPKAGGEQSDREMYYLSTPRNTIEMGGETFVPDFSTPNRFKAQIQIIRRNQKQTEKNRHITPLKATHMAEMPNRQICPGQS
eukprot:EG_transcript_17701